MKAWRGRLAVLYAGGEREVGLRFWFVHSGEVPLREQIVTQIVLGIGSGELRPGERLPSTRELARRFRLHANTVGAAYRQLEAEGRVESRHGSGVYVRGGGAAPAGAVGAGSAGRGRRAEPASLGALDRMIAGFFQAARESGAPMPVVHQRLRQWLDVQPADHFLLIEPDAELGRIVQTELQEAVQFPVRVCGFEEMQAGRVWSGALTVVLPSKAEVVGAAMPAGMELVVLQVGSVPGSLGAWLPAPADALLGVASSWPEFLKFARTMLVAAGFAPEALVFRDAREKGWTQGFEAVAAVVCDAVTEGRLPRKVRAIPFRVVAETSIAELRRCEEAIRTRLDPLG